MSNLVQSRILPILCAVIFLVSSAAAQETSSTAVAPVPPALLTGKKIFVSNVGADSGLFPHPFSGTPDRAYNQFYAAVQKWGRYQCVADPSDADLVFELRLTRLMVLRTQTNKKARRTRYRCSASSSWIAKPTMFFGR
jgi:hypothetical protein